MFRVKFCILFLSAVFVGVALAAPPARYVRQPSPGANEATAIVPRVEGGESRSAVENQTTVDADESTAKVRDAPEDHHDHQADQGSASSVTATKPAVAEDTKHSTDLTASSAGSLSSQTIAGSPVGGKVKRDVASHSGPVGNSSGVSGNTHGSSDAHYDNQDPDTHKSA